MAWPPAALPTNRTNGTPQQDNHPSDHNALGQAINDTVAKVRTIPSRSGYATIGVAARLLSPTAGNANTASLSVPASDPADGNRSVILHAHIGVGVSSPGNTPGSWEWAITVDGVPAISARLNDTGLRAFENIEMVRTWLLDPNPHTIALNVAWPGSTSTAVDTFADALFHVLEIWRP